MQPSSTIAKRYLVFCSAMVQLASLKADLVLFIATERPITHISTDSSTVYTWDDVLQLHLMEQLLTSGERDLAKQLAYQWAKNSEARQVWFASGRLSELETLLYGNLNDDTHQEEQ